MKIEIKNGEIRGVLFIKYPNRLLSNPNIVPDHELYNLEYWLVYNLESFVYAIEMRGSIVSMMQFRKFILMNWPDALKE